MNPEMEMDHRCMQSSFIPSTILEDRSPDAPPGSVVWFLGTVTICHASRFTLLGRRVIRTSSLQT